MSYYLGIDLGTSSVKLLLVDESGEICGSVTKEYPLSFPHPGWSEQDPADWWKAVQYGILQLTEKVDKSEIRGIGCGGQMHGLVALDERDTVSTGFKFNDWELKGVPVLHRAEASVDEKA